jgi:hypothetical protein
MRNVEEFIPHTIQKRGAVTRRLQLLLRDGSIVLRFLIVALVVSVLLLSAKASLFKTSAIAQAPMQSML